MSRTVFGLVAVGAVVIAIALGVAWRGKMTEQAAIDRPNSRYRDLEKRVEPAIRL